MASLDTSAYKKIFRVRQAYAFDLGGLLMRFIVYMSTLGSITMLTLSGYNFLEAGTIASTIAVATLAISPQISRQIDARGQSKVIPWAAALMLLGLGGLIANVTVGGPWWLCYPFAVLMGFIPNPSSITRTRWAYLLRTGRLGEDAPDIQTIFSYEGIVDDCAFMFGPSISIALAATLFPAAGMLFGFVAFALGTVVVLMSRSTEPEVGWEATRREGAAGESKAAEERAERKSSRNVLLAYPAVAILFVLMALQGAFFGIFDSALVAFAEEIQWTEFASIILPPASVISISMGFAFGMVRLAWKPSTQLACVALFFGVTYGAMFMATDVVSLAVVYLVGSFSYAPLLITLNMCCERCVPGGRLTEALTWLTAGSTLGCGIGPTLAGTIIDQFGGVAGFACSSAFAIAVPVVTLLALPYLRKLLDR